MSREFQVIVYGASGYTGKLVSDVLYNKSDIKWAMAGRNLLKLKETLDEIQVTGKLQDIPLLLATVDDPRTLVELASRAKVLINCAGPFNQSGLAVVAACVESGCHYVDITGEPTFYLDSLKMFEKRAQEKGVCIVHACGLDSLPWDLGVLSALQGSTQRFYSNVTSVTTTAALSITPTTGTILSAIDVLSNIKMNALFATVEAMIGAKKDRHAGLKTLSSKLVANIPRVPVFPHYSRDLHQWVVPVPGLLDSIIVRRSAQLLRKKDPAAPANYHYAQYLAVGSFFNMVLYLVGALWVFPILLLVARVAPLRKALSKFLRDQGDGPTVAQRKASAAKFVTVAKDSQGTEVGRSVVTCPSDPGYGSTAKWISEAALCLVEEPAADEPAVEGGVFTTASCNVMGFNLIRRVKKANLKFE